MFDCFCPQQSFPAGITAESPFARSGNRFPTPRAGDGGSCQQGEKTWGQELGKGIGGTGLPLLPGAEQECKNREEEKKDPAATATEDLSLPPPSRTRRQLPRSLVTACSEGVSAKNIPLTTGLEISGPSRVLYICHNMTA